jgi:PAS domain-containing protein
VSRPLPQPVATVQIIRGYVLAVLSVLFAVLIAHWPVIHLESAPVSLFFCAVMVSAWVGGAGPGSLATILSSVAFYYSFLPPVDSFAAKPGQVARFSVFTLSAVLVGSLSAAQRKAAESLRRTRDDLRDTVQKLMETNDKLTRSEAYLAEAQTLSHTGSFGWDVSTGEQFWSAETFRIFEYEPTLKPTVELALERIHPEDLPLVQQVMTSVSEHGRDVDVEHRLLMPDGSVKTVRVLGHTSNDRVASRNFSEPLRTFRK